MAKQGILFDLDMTLVDTSCLEHLRSQRNWQSVYKHIPDTILYAGIGELIDELSRKYLLGVVTSSPRPYAERVIKFHSLSLKVLAAYHDTRYHKPHEAPLLYGCQKLGLSPDIVFSIGDEINDFKASNAAGIDYLHTSWGDNSNSTIPEAIICRTVPELKNRLL